MCLRSALLGLLAEGPATGYELVREFDASHSVIWPAPQGELYRELAKLETLGLARPDLARGTRRQRKWHITPAGRAEFRRWITWDSDHALRYESMLKAAFLSNARKDDVAALIERERAYFAAELASLKNSPVRPERDYGRMMVFSFYEAMSRWCREVAKTLDEPAHEVAIGAPARKSRSARPAPPVRRVKASG